MSRTDLGADPAARPADRHPLPADREVVRTLVRLKLRLLANGLRRSPQRRAVYLVGTGIGLLFVGLIATAFAFLHGHAGAADAAALLVSGMTLSWAALPLFLFSTDESADPTRLTMLPLRPRAMLRGTLLGALIGPGPVLTTLLLTGAVIAAATGAAAVPFAVLGVPLALVTLVTLSRAVAAGNARLLSSRRGKDFAIFGGLLFALLIQGGNILSQSVLGGKGSLDLSGLHPVASVLRWVPPVSAIDAARSAGDGAYGTAVAQLALAAALLALLLRWWGGTLQQLMVTADASTQIDTASVSRSRLTGILPPGRAGAAMQRHLRYAWREPRAKAAVFTSIGMTLVFCVLSVVQGWSSVYVVAVAGLMLGLQMVNLFGMDGSAFWMVASTIATRRDARDELRGRALAVVAYAVPSVLVLALVLAAATGQWGQLPAAFGLTLAGLGSGLGLGAMLSVLAPYTMPADSNPMRNAAPGQSGVVLLNSFGSMVGVAVLTAPVGVLLGVLAGTDSPTWPVLLVGPLYGALLAVVGVRTAAERLLQRLPEILAVAVERSS